MKKQINIAELIKKKLEYLVSFLCILLILIFSFTKSGRTLELGLYDTLLGIKPEIKQRQEILLVDIDDYAIEQIGAFPWTRDVIADSLIRLREVGGSNIVFDIEYMTPGQSGVNRDYVKNEFPLEYKNAQTDIVDYVSSFSDAIASYNLPVEVVPEYGAEMTQYIENRLTEVSTSISDNIFRDNDEYFAKAIHFFGNTFLTINYERINVSEEALALEQWALLRFLFQNVQDSRHLILKENLERLEESDFDKGISPAIQILLNKAKGAGFPNVVIDEDGVRRRIELLAEYDNAYVGQLVFTPILSILQPEQIIRKGQKLILVNANDPNNLSGAKKNITIPLDEKGRLLINWLKRTYTDSQKPENGSFRHMSVYALYYADAIEDKLITNLTKISELSVKNAAGYLSYHDAALWLLSSYDDLSIWKQDLLDEKKDNFDEYFEARNDFFANYAEFLDGGFDTELYETFETFAERTGDAQYLEYSENIKKNWLIYKENYNHYMEHLATLKQTANQAFCIIGWSGLGTSDLGVNPFKKSYPNVGTHANIYNTIMSQAFIKPFPQWASWLLAFGMGIISVFAYRRIKSLKGRLVFGIASSILLFILLLSVFVFFGIYIQVLVPLFSVILSFILISLFKFVFSEQEKNFLRKAFTTYLSSDVVDEIVNDPSKLKLGGQEKVITALFTDIKSFSSLSEKVTPEHLVQILNKYLTRMSDLVLDQKGTIDKYIGDAIVAFFGAPNDLPDHATRACLAAVRIKQAEKLLNEEMLANNETPSPIYTRIGINTGPMVVGNMGTENKMNYTIMGNDVNLSARLEGVNKSYGTWILVSERTWNETNDQFLGRKLDRVRVVGIETPVQLYNIMAVKSEADAQFISLAGKFNQAIDAYREKRFGEALRLFQKCLEIAPDDDTSKIFLDRVSNLLKNGVPEGWTDIINMTSK